MGWPVLLVVLLAGCAGLDRAPRAEIPQASAGIAAPEEAVQAETGLSAPPEAKEIESAIVAPAPAVQESSPAKAAPAPVKAAVKEVAPMPAAPAPAVVPARKAEEPAVAAKAREPALDVSALKLRLRDTTAIGVMAKLSLRKQMDELLESFRDHYAGSQKSSLAALRKPYDALVIKVLDLLQEGDPSLARSIASSREAIWGILADRERFGLLH